MSKRRLEQEAGKWRSVELGTGHGLEYVVFQHVETCHMRLRLRFRSTELWLSNNEFDDLMHALGKLHERWCRID